MNMKNNILVQQFKQLFVAFIISVFVLCFASVNASELMRFSSGIRAPLSNAHHTGFNDRITTEAFRRAGYRIEILKLPAARALEDLNNGFTDGDLLRVEEICRAYPNIIIVPEKIMDFDFVAISSEDMEFSPNGWGSLLPYELGIVSGWKILERKVKSNESVTKVEDTEQLIRILVNDRIDIAISERWQVKNVIKNYGENKKITVHETPIKRNSMYIVLNIKHKLLVPKIALAIKSMKKDGTFDEIYNETLGKLK